MSTSLPPRHLESELMDDPALAVPAHAAALRGLARLNRWSGSPDILWPTIRNLCRENPGRPVRLLDIATGSGDVPIQLWLKAKREGLALDIEACDRSGTALDIARQHAHDAGATVRFFSHDVLAQPLPGGYDTITSSLFLHHLEPEHVIPFLKNLVTSDARLVLINDLERSRLGLVVVWLACRILTRSPIVHVDGPRSVRAAFTPSETLQLAREAGMINAAVARRWPFRYLLEWRRP